MVKYRGRGVSYMVDFTANIVLESNTAKKWPVAVVGKLDTGARRTSIDEDLASFLRLEECGETTVTNAMGKQNRKLVKLNLIWEHQLYSVEASVTDRGNLSTPVIIGQDIIGD